MMQHTGAQSQNHKCGKRWNSIKGALDGAPNNLGLSAILWEIISSDAWWIVLCDIMYLGLSAALMRCSPGHVLNK